MDYKGTKGWLLQKIPYSYDYQIRKRADELFSREMLGAVLVGKFVGDYAAIRTTWVLGTDLGYVFGIVFTIVIFIYWDRIEQKAKAKKDQMSHSQSQLSEFSSE